MDISNILTGILVISAVVSAVIYRNIIIGRGRVNLDGSIVFLFGEFIWSLLYICQISVISLRHKLFFYNLTFVAASISVIGLFIFVQSLTMGNLKSRKIGYGMLGIPLGLMFYTIYEMLRDKYEIFAVQTTLREFNGHNFIVFSNYTRLGYMVFLINVLVVVLSIVFTLTRFHKLNGKQKKNISFLLILFFLMNISSFQVVLQFKSYNILNFMMFNIIAMFPLKLFIYFYISNADLFNLMMVNRYSLVENIKDSIIVVDGKGRILDYNKASKDFEQDFTVKKMEDIDNFFKHLEIVAPEFSLESNLGKSVEYGIYLEDGKNIIIEIEVMEIEVRKMFFRNNYKKDYMVFIRDISAEYKQELDFMKYKTAFYAMNVGIAIVNIQGKVENINPGFTVLTGFTEEEMIGNSLGELKSEFHTRDFYNQLWKTISSGRTWQGRFYNKRKDGSNYWEKDTISPIFNKKGEITHYIAIKQDVTNEKHQEDELKEKSYVDFLTGVYNRRRLMEKSSEAFYDAKELNMPLAVLIMDIDKFKLVNDNFGHNFGDQVLKEFAKICVHLVRKDDIFGRYGGEEFLAVLPSATPEAAIRAAERIREGMEKHPFNVKGETHFFTVSIGIAILDSEQDQNLEAVIARADKALYQAKNTGRNKVVII